MNEIARILSFAWISISIVAIYKSDNAANMDISGGLLLWISLGVVCGLASQK